VIWLYAYQASRHESSSVSRRESGPVHRPFGTLRNDILEYDQSPIDKKFRCEQNLLFTVTGKMNSARGVITLRGITRALGRAQRDTW
jgi:hypothetical protein